jgi:hypothetical protein
VGPRRTVRMLYEIGRCSESGWFGTEPAKNRFVPLVGPYLPPNWLNWLVLLDRNGFNNNCSLGFDALLSRVTFSAASVGVGTTFSTISQRSCTFKNKVTLAFQDRRLDAPSNWSSNLRLAVAISRSEQKSLLCEYSFKHPQEFYCWFIDL